MLTCWWCYRGSVSHSVSAMNVCMYFIKIYPVVVEIVVDQLKQPTGFSVKHVTSEFQHHQLSEYIQNYSFHDKHLWLYLCFSHFRLPE